VSRNVPVRVNLCHVDVTVTVAAATVAKGEPLYRLIGTEAVPLAVRSHIDAVWATAVDVTTCNTAPPVAPNTNLVDVLVPAGSGTSVVFAVPVAVTIIHEATVGVFDCKIMFVLVSSISKPRHSSVVGLNSILGTFMAADWRRPFCPMKVAVVERVNVTRLSTVSEPAKFRSSAGALTGRDAAA
jgi:hypothetical protein